MKPLKAVTKFTRYGDVDLSLYAVNVCSAMQGNAHFPNPVPALPALLQATNIFRDALVASQTGDRVLIAGKNEKRQKLITMLKQLTSYANNIAQGNAQKLLSSALVLSKETPVASVEKPLVTLKEGRNTGDIVARATGAGNARAYMFQLSADAGNNKKWESFLTTTSSIVFKDLKPATTYYVRVQAVGTKGQVRMSNVVARVTQQG